METRKGCILKSTYGIRGGEETYIGPTKEWELDTFAAPGHNINCANCVE
jgi:hypothetical protein